jgi:hypothetical protein
VNRAYAIHAMRAANATTTIAASAARPVTAAARLRA